MTAAPLVLLLLATTAPVASGGDPWVRYLENRLRLAPGDAELRDALRRARRAAPAAPPVVAAPRTPEARLRDELLAYARGTTRRTRAGWNPGRTLQDAGRTIQARIYLAPAVAPAPPHSTDPPASADTSPPAVPPAPVAQRFDSDAQHSAAESPSTESETFSRRFDLAVARGEIDAAAAVVAAWRAAHPQDRAAVARARLLAARTPGEKERAKRGAALAPLADDTLPIRLREALRTSDASGARALARRWRAARPPDAESWALIGLAFRRVGAEADARAAWRRSLEIDPDQPDLAALLATAAPAPPAP